MITVAAAGLREGQEIEGRPRVLTRGRLLAFSGGTLGTPDWPDRNLHTDAGAARDAGLDRPIASGQQAEGDLLRLLLGLFGDDWFAGGRLRVKFIKPVRAGDTVHARLRVRSVHRFDGGTTFVLDARCENQTGETVLAGEAVCRCRAGHLE